MSLLADIEAVNDEKEPVGILGADTLTSSLGDATHIALPLHSILSLAWLTCVRCLYPHTGVGAGRCKDLTSNGNASHSSPVLKGRSWQHPSRGSRKVGATPASKNQLQNEATWKPPPFSRADPDGPEIRLPRLGFSAQKLAVGNPRVCCAPRSSRVGPETDNPKIWLPCPWTNQW